MTTMTRIASAGVRTGRPEGLRYVLLPDGRPEGLRYVLLPDGRPEGLRYVPDTSSG
jgi:hypothetical protein